MTLTAILAGNVIAERHRRRLRQADLADRINWSQSSVSALERGRRAADVDDLLALCRTLDVTLHDLLRGAPAEDLRRLGL